MRTNVKKRASYWALGCPHAARHEVARMLVATGKYDRETAERKAREAEVRANNALSAAQDQPS